MNSRVKSLPLIVMLSTLSRMRRCGSWRRCFVRWSPTSTRPIRGDTRPSCTSSSASWRARSPEGSTGKVGLEFGLIWLSSDSFCYMSKFLESNQILLDPSRKCLSLSTGRGTPAATGGGATGPWIPPASAMPTSPRWGRVSFLVNTIIIGYCEEWEKQVSK